MARTLEEITEALIERLGTDMDTESAILAALSEAREGALREAATWFGANVGRLDQGGAEEAANDMILALASSRPEPAPRAATAAGPVHERAPRPGEACRCGRPAVTVYLTELHGEVPYCGIHGIPDGGRAGAHRAEPPHAAPAEGDGARGERVRDYVVRVCDGCRRLEGEMCTTPGCVFCFRPVSEVAAVLDAALLRPVVDGERLDLMTPIPSPEPAPSEPESGGATA